MNFKQLFTDDRAVSPVIGVILMVAITVILAAVIGTFVLGLGNNLQQTPPNANFDFDYAAGNNPSVSNVTAIHEGGATFNAENTGNLTVEADGVSPVDFDLPVSSGESEKLANVPDGTTVRVIWTAPDGGNSQTIAEGQTPS